MRRERLYLEDILAAADAIAAFIQGQKAELFEANLMLRSAVAQQLTVIGEAVARSRSCACGVLTACRENRSAGLKSRAG